MSPLIKVCLAITIKQFLPWPVECDMPQSRPREFLVILASLGQTKIIIQKRYAATTVELRFHKKITVFYFIFMLT